MKILRALLNVGFNDHIDNDHIDNDVKVTDRWHITGKYMGDITGKYRGSAYRDYIINVMLNHIISVVFHNLKNYVSHLIMQELGKFNLKINIIPNGLEKCMSFSIYINIRFTDSFQFLSSSLDSIVRNLAKDDFKYFSPEFDNNVLDLFALNELIFARLRKSNFASTDFRESAFSKYFG